MTTDTKPKPPASDVKWLPIKSITFNTPTTIPGAPSASILRGDIVQENMPRWTIEYAPSWRHVRITFYSTDQRTGPKVCMVPESTVRTWEPLTE